MIVRSEGMKTEVSVLPYERSSIDSFGYIQSFERNPFLVKSVEGNEEHLVEIVLPSGESMIARADQLITAVQKCVR